MTVECIRFRSFKNKSLIGFADFWIPKMGIELYGCSLHQKDGRRWINFPSKEYKDESGEVKYQSILRFRDKEHFFLFCEEAKKAIDKWCLENGTEM